MRSDGIEDRARKVDYPLLRGYKKSTGRGTVYCIVHVIGSRGETDGEHLDSNVGVLTAPADANTGSEGINCVLGEAAVLDRATDCGYVRGMGGISWWWEPIWGQKFPSILRWSILVAREEQ
jgi:hypothetical protein